MKPLLIATPVRDKPKSMPKLNPPIHLESIFLLIAFGGNGSSLTDDDDISALIFETRIFKDFEGVFGSLCKRLVGGNFKNMVGSC